jgi:hypothetical protein
VLDIPRTCFAEREDRDLVFALRQVELRSWKEGVGVEGAAGSSLAVTAVA